VAEHRFMTVVFRERDRIGIERLADRLSTPGNPYYGIHLTRDQLRALVQLDAAELDEVRKWFTDQGMTIEEQENPNPQRLVVKGTPEQIEAAFGENPKDWQELEMDVRRAPRVALPGRLDGHVQKISGVLGDLTRGCRRVYGLMDDTPEPPPDLVTKEQVTAGLTPQDIREIYNFPPLPRRNGRGDRGLDGSGQTIALLMLGGRVDESTLKQFWGAHGVDPPPDVDFVQVGPRNPARPENRIHDFEAAMSVEWAGAKWSGAGHVGYKNCTTH
jgi:kumamolisin